MASYEWRVAKNGTRRYVRVETVAAPAPRGKQPVESDASVKVIPSDAPVGTVTAVGPATVRPASATTVTTTTRRRTTKKASKPAAKKSDG